MVEWTLLKHVNIFVGLTETELQRLAVLFTSQTVGSGAMIIEEKTKGRSMYIIADGSVEVFITGSEGERVLVVLGKDQVFGEMALIDQGYRSASVRASSGGCKLYVMDRKQFMELIESNTRIGYIVMRNLASDLAFKLRHHNLAQL